MNKKNVEKQLRESFNSVTPNVYQSIERDVANLDVSRAVTRRTNRRNLFWKLCSGVLSLVLVVMAVIGVVSTVNQTAQASAVSLDVNPSVEIVLNRSNRVVRVNALNDDGKIIIADMDFNGCQLKVAVNALIGSMLRAGYLSDMANSVLVSVDADKSSYQTIAELVANEITVTLKQGQIEASVVSQWIQNDDDVAAIAKQYGISLGKAQLINKIVGKTDYTAEQLAQLSINELSLLLPNVGIEDDVEQSGAASDKKYIEQDAALSNALAASKVEGLTAQTEGLRVRKTKLDFDDGEMVYDVEYVYDSYEYEVEIGAISGEVVAFEKCLTSYYVEDSSNRVIADREQAKAYALSLAGVDETAAENVFAEKTWYFRGTVYEVCFRTEQAFYQYCVGADGTVLEERYEMISLSDEDSYLTRQQVVAWFLANNGDGFTRLDGTDRMRVYGEKTVDGRLTYELSFVSGGNLYVYKIDAVNKVILSRTVTEFTAGNDKPRPGDGFEHGFGDWYWGDWDDFDFDDDFDDFDDDFDDDDFGDHRGPHGRPAY